ncbi:hypothetical protein [Niabella aurantiaca]|uniref:hypothetical protein n=1 Tax=Niabella aurantiaca TaxID=379900 RepID=UPI000374AD27|nr:hypothetical protein [Niabella aurantiaca]
MEETKLSLSPEERAIVAAPEIILTKNAVLDKVKTALELLYRWQLDFVKENASLLPAGLLENNGKISKGEYYNGLPYLILDYPRNFAREQTAAVRSLFWWGRQVSTTLHLSGGGKDRFSVKLGERFEALKTGGYFLSYSGSEWEHDAGSSNYVPLHTLEKGEWLERLHNSAFIKLARVAPMEELENAPQFWRRSFRDLMMVLAGV